MLVAFADMILASFQITTSQRPPSPASDFAAAATLTPPESTVVGSAERLQRLFRQ